MKKIEVQNLPFRGHGSFKFVNLVGYYNNARGYNIELWNIADEYRVVFQHRPLFGLGGFTLYSVDYDSIESFNDTLNRYIENVCDTLKWEVE